MTRLLKGTGNILNEYGLRLRAFRPNARLYLVNVIITGAAMGVFRLLFNFYVLSLGYDEALLGNLVTINSATALLMALPSGYVADRLGRKASLLISGGLSSLSVISMVIWPNAAIFYLANIAFGIAQSLGAVTMAPFLMENSGDDERTYLFSFGAGLQMASASAGNWIGGYLPGWVGAYRSVSPMDSQAYSGALAFVALLTTFSLLPLLMMRMPRLEFADRSIFAPIEFARHHTMLLVKLILPILLISIGAGLIMPFMNVFFRNVHNQPDPVIGTLFAWGSLAMGLGLLVAPPLAERLGKIRFVTLTQGLSIPFLAIMGFAPWFWLSAAAYYVRLALMNMSTPIYNTFVMERVEPSDRATIASLSSMSWSFGWAFSPTISGWFQVHYGFGPAFIGTILLYSVSIYLYWAFFLRRMPKPAPVTIAGG